MFALIIHVSIHVLFFFLCLSQHFCFDLSPFIFINFVFFFFLHISLASRMQLTLNKFFVSVFLLLFAPCSMIISYGRHLLVTYRVSVMLINTYRLYLLLLCMHISIFHFTITRCICNLTTKIEMKYGNHVGVCHGIL